MRIAISLALLGATAFAASPARAADPSTPPTISDCLLSAEASLKLRSEHKLRETRTQLLVCSSASCPVEVRQECMRRMDEANTALPTLVLAVKNSDGQDLSAVKVTMDGEPLTDHLDGSALQIDPGAHEFKFEAAGEPSLTETIILHEGEKDRRETVVLGARSSEPQPAPEAKEAKTSEPEPGAEAPPESPGKALRIAGITAIAVGGVGVGVGAVFGALASSAWSKAKGECPSHTDCSSAAMSDRSRAVSLATGSTVGLIAGGVLLAGGLTLFFVAPKGGAAAGVGLQIGPGSLAVAGGF